MYPTNYNTKKVFIGDNKYIVAQYTNSTGATVTLSEGRLMGRVFSSNKVLPNVSSATDGSQSPIGVLKGNYTVANNATVNVIVCVKGDVARDMITLGGSDTLATTVTTSVSVTGGGGGAVAVPHGTIEDILRRNSGIYLIAGDELRGTDNQ